MSDDNISENMPVIKSRTGNFLRSMFDKKAPIRNRTRSTPISQQEFMQVVPEPITWDEGEETNWDDDFIEAPQPAFMAPAVEQPSAPPPPPPPAFKSARPVAESAEAPALVPDFLQPSVPEPTAVITPPAPPRSIAAQTDEATRSTTIEVSIPRPKNIKYKSKDPNVEPVSTVSNKPSTSKNEAINLDIQRPKNIRYKTNLPAKASLPERLLAPVKSLAAKIAAPFDQTPKIYIEQVPADGKISVKKPWQLPSLGRENLRQALTIAGALFLAMTVAWAVINFWPHSVAATLPAPPAQPAPVKPPIQPPTKPVSPEAALEEAVKNQSQALASLYPAGLIANLELDNSQSIATVTVSDLWFSLTSEQQQQTAQSLWQQARNYQMSGLEVRGATDRLLARSPLVGTAAILTSQ